MSWPLGKSSRNFSEIKNRPDESSVGEPPFMFWMLFKGVDNRVHHRNPYFLVNPLTPLPVQMCYCPENGMGLSIKTALIRELAHSLEDFHVFNQPLHISPDRSGSVESKTDVTIRSR